VSAWLARFDSADAAVAAARALRARGISGLEIFASYEIDAAVEALELPRPRAVLRSGLISGLLGAGGSYLVQWYTAAVSYPLDVGGRPLHSAPAFIPITFEGGVLAAAFGAFFAFFALARLPRLWQPEFEVEGFGDTTRDGIWLAARDARSELGADHLVELGARCVEPLGDGR
jgi:hypothetical protein